MKLAHFCVTCYDDAQDPLLMKLPNHFRITLLLPIALVVGCLGVQGISEIDPPALDQGSYDEPQPPVHSNLMADINGRDVKYVLTDDNGAKFQRGRNGDHTL